jgi:hypothetical protein
VQKFIQLDEHPHTPYYIPVGYIIYKITRAVSGEKIRFRGHDLHAQAHIAAEASRRLTEGLVI